MNNNQKLEYYCAYQERCHQEVVQKLYDLKISTESHDEIIVHLITHNFLNEERFAKAFARGKHTIKKWGRIRIVNELKFRKISAHNVKVALQEIDDEAYEVDFQNLAQHQWEICSEKNNLKKKKKVADYLFRKGYERELVYDFLNQTTH